ncbi:MAG: methyltransferase, TIGR04325 family [Caulobacterales bacterium]
MITRALGIAASHRPLAQVLAATPFVKNVLRARTLAPDGLLNGFWGAFDHREDACAAIPANLPRDWNRLGLHHDLHDKKAQAIALDWLARELTPGARVVHLGGGDGGLYDLLVENETMPDGVEWLVVETLALVEAAAAHTRGGLSFATTLPEHAPDILIVSGYLQYVHADMVGFFASLPWEPGAILINKAPLALGSAFWTLQNLGRAVTPYRVYREAEFVAAIDRAGFDVLDRWTAPELRVDIPFHPERSVAALSGLWLKKRKPPISAPCKPGLTSLSLRLSLRVPQALNR